MREGRILDVTDKVKEIFGSKVVKRAYIEDCHEYNPLTLDKIDFNNFDAETVIIEFKEGNTVRIGNSEWGWIQKVREYGWVFSMCVNVSFRILVWKRL